MNEETETLRAAIRNELGLLWGDLADAKGSAIRTAWSIQALNLAERIGQLSQLVGPTPWDEVPLPLLEDGTYEQVVRAVGLEPYVDWLMVRECRREIERQDAEFRERWRS